MDIIPLGPAQNGKIDQKFGKAEQKNGAGFKDTINNYVSEVNDLQVKAGESIENFATGKVENVHEVMIAMSKAEVSFKFMMETRNKLVDAYKEIMRMQV
ncbi:MAG: flagellar hook-basal body complex protein FliE [Candidatus Scalindua sp.]|uniref:Flagellar hook-basal body complex protein FliE n=1 Tax=Candidatus Scalindua brodae TaxID=237368 RepID=A0A0B0EU53_9BACT|nr:MAG: flagellar hook-basal body complex protein FliE [Candidatus Scalindua brodae]MBZ0107232.1 flagellar hook-basal body complex protein FliE [Candidatus Scalindua rubra]MCR4289875.1 flagellar hook-basal body complex protein FliE [Candidatus Scalindua sp.]MCR4344805.1 flagellar hook-basal body complex protein FliE [Candidatus Scalindua sp.]TWU31671.1 Flagellar hook-basal body complex protein FliE [Candidatus Brocadiaceae bacterium S225]